jgi:hypothetical protein
MDTDQNTDDPAEEGWFTDPYGRHEARWLSAGHPTKLVRDGGVESYDEPPDEPASRIPVRLEEDPVEDGGEGLRRADEAEVNIYDQANVNRAVLDVFDETATSK